MKGLLNKLTLEKFEKLYQEFLKVTTPANSISQKVFITSFRNSEFPLKFVNVFFIIVIIKDKLTDLCGY